MGKPVFQLASLGNEQIFQITGHCQCNLCIPDEAPRLVIGQASRLTQNRTAFVWWAPFRVLAFAPLGQSRPPFSILAFLPWPMQIEIHLARCLLYTDQFFALGKILETSAVVRTMFCLATSLQSYGLANVKQYWRKHNTLSILVCPVTGTPLSHSSITCLQVGSYFFEWLVVPPGEFVQSSLSPSREDRNDGHFGKCSSCSPTFTMEARCSSTGLRRVTGNTAGLIGSPFPRTLPGEENTTTSLELRRTTTLSVFKKFVGRVTFSRLCSYWSRDSSYIVRLYRIMWTQVDRHSASIRISCLMKQWSHMWSVERAGTTSWAYDQEAVTLWPSTSTSWLT